MDNDIRSEHICSTLRDLLNEESVKLWLSPYYQDGKSDDTKIEELAQKYSSSLELPVSELKESLLLLQSRSLSRLREQEEFRASGLCTVRVKISAVSSSASSDEATCSKNLSTPATFRTLPVSVFLSDTGKVLLQKVADSAGIPAYRLKLISQGRIIDPAATLQSQGVKNSAQMMAVVLTENPGEINEAASRHKLLEDTRADVLTLVSSRKTAYFELLNQQGNAVELPASERRALLVAMALHERGKAFLMRGDLALALVLFLEADKEFKKCASELLKSVDNAALLNLDIAWCYLCLRSVSHLPDAQKRLQECQEMLVRSYGPNMERVIAIKGTSGNEAVLMMRLHLLQAIVMFHQNKIPECRKLLSQVGEELNRLKVRDEDMCSLISLGYKSSEARLGLRAAHGDIALAEVYINEWQRQKREAHERNLQRAKLERERQKLGLCADGQHYVEPSLVQMIQGMGYDRETAVCALAHTNNVVSEAVAIISESPHLLEPRKSRLKYRIDKEALKQVARGVLKIKYGGKVHFKVNGLAHRIRISTMGFDWRLAKKALKKHNGNVEKALDYLFKHPPRTDQDDIESLMEAMNDIGDDAESDRESQGSQDSQDSQSDAACVNQEEAFKRLAPDIDHSDEYHLDQTLVAEERFFKEYQLFLQKLGEKK